MPPGRKHRASKQDCGSSAAISYQWWQLMQAVSCEAARPHHHAPSDNADPSPASKLLEGKGRAPGRIWRRRSDGPKKMDDGCGLRLIDCTRDAPQEACQVAILPICRSCGRELTPTPCGDFGRTDWSREDLWNADYGVRPRWARKFGRSDRVREAGSEGPGPTWWIGSGPPEPAPREDPAPGR